MGYPTRFTDLDPNDKHYSIYAKIGYIFYLLGVLKSDEYPFTDSHSEFRLRNTIVRYNNSLHKKK